MSSTTPTKKWKFWVVADIGTTEPEFRALACVEQEIKPGVHPPYAVGRFLRFLRVEANRLMVSRDVDKFRMSSFAIGKNPVFLPFLTTMLLHAAAFNHEHGEEHVSSAVSLDPATAFGPIDSNISFGVVDISEVLEPDWDGGPEPRACFLFPFGMHRDDGKMQAWDRKPLWGTQYAEAFEGDVDMYVPTGWEMCHDVLFQPKFEEPICCPRQVIARTWPLAVHGVQWKMTGYEERGHTPHTDYGDEPDYGNYDYDNSDQDEDGDEHEDEDKDEEPVTREVVVPKPRPLEYRPHVMKSAEGPKLLSDELRSANSRKINMVPFLYSISAANLGSVFSELDEDVRDKIEYLDVSKYQIKKDVLVQIARCFPHLKHINMMWNEALPGMTCFEALEKSLGSLFKIQTITHQDLFRSATLTTAQLTSRPYYPTMRAMLSGQVTQIIYTSVRTWAAIPKDHDWLRLEDGGLDWDHILGSDEAIDDTFWACIPCREADMRSANWEIWWPKVVAFFQKKRLCDPYGSSPTNILPRRRFFEAFAHAMVLPYATPGKYTRWFNISPIPLGPYHHAAHLDIDPTMTVESFAQEMMFTLVIVAEDIGDTRLLRHGFVTSAVQALESKPFNVLSLESYRKAMDAPDGTIPDELKMEGDEHVCSQAEVETVLGPDLLRLSFYGPKGVDKNRNVVFEGVPTMRVTSE